ncbi:NAD-glutamate dehydrogenase [Aestuariimicrobium ganziense]|uniref:NAD-glutamate dehydrogenase n=1 Tax=Aestuariimicrobium ganziense TaxID=2773677 RepID=UPI002E28C801|nr:NAD-glutamate dehydrogenase [Aestuariimicrobium ganziense]
MVEDWARQAFLDSVATATQGRSAALVEGYLRRVPTEQLGGLDPVQVGHMIDAHAELSASRPGDQPAIRIWAPGEADWVGANHHALQVVSPDRPFVVDTIELTLTRLGWAIHDLHHPQLDIGGHPESWVHVDVVAPRGDPDDQRGELAGELRQALDDLAVVVDDWAAMQQRVHQVAADLDPDLAELLTWLADDHSLLLGTRQHRLEAGELVAVPGTGLGLLRDGQHPVSDFEVVPADPMRAQRVIVTKDSARSTIRRGGHIDHLAVRTFDEDGRCTGEHRILGLLSRSAYTDPVDSIPLVREKAARVRQAIGYPPGSHGARAVEATIASFPRDELFQAPVDQLVPAIARLAELRERRELRSFMRWSTGHRFLYVLVSLPRDRYSTESRRAMEQAIGSLVPVASLDFRTQFFESVLCRVFFTVRIDPAVLAQGDRPEVDPVQLQAVLAGAVKTWEDTYDALAADLDRAAREVDFPDSYKESTTPEQAVEDVQQLLALDEADDMQLAIHRPEGTDIAQWRVKVMRTGATMTLSEVMPQWTSLGVQVVDERPHQLELAGRQVMVYDFGLRHPEAEEWDEGDRARIMAAFEAVHRGWVDADPLNALVTATDLDWRQVNLLRALTRYLLQTPSQYSHAYVTQTLLALPHLATGLAALMAAKFDPDQFVVEAGESGEQAMQRRLDEVERLRTRLLDDLDRVSLLDQDRIVRWLLAIVDACVRTNHHQVRTGRTPQQFALALKLRPELIEFLPEPRPAFEVFVHSVRVEGVHLRFGAVARGGLRWSDRAEDFRTEVLGLAKAQLVKNAVIVPVGAKGGFLPRQLPDAADREAWLDEGRACYRIFVGALLDVTDNLVAGEVVHPERTVRHDGDDTYLVVAADKGTAAFADLANEVSLERGYWLGDAFASGGSKGYDHKAMGITARGAWESVKRHFAEMGVDCQQTDFTCVGIGDMSGDVFGNGMLQSEHIRLVAAFNHQHVFVDPDPDAAVGHAERLRLFQLPRSAWTDYDPSLISEGGGVFERSSKSVPISEPIRRALGLDAEVTELTGSQLVQAVLAAPVDLLFNGGIGTYVKASTQTDAEAGDRANDAVRVDATQLRCRVVAEGGNLGLTQPARVEYAQGGGRVNADFIDNSAGVDSSDHEVNIKILLGLATESGLLSASDRDNLLPTMTDEIAELVLRHNIDQNVALSNALARAVDFAGLHQSLMDHLAASSDFDREVDEMPSRDELERRIAAGEGLTSPELATLMAWTKLDLAEELLATDLPDDPYLADRLVTYFPHQLRERFAEQMAAHPLRREIITTVAVNRFVNSQGITAAARLTDEFGVGPDHVVRAQLAARSIFSAGGVEVAVARAGVHPDMQREIRLACRRLVDRGTRWLLQNLPHPIEVQATIDQYRGGVETLVDRFGELLVPDERDRVLDRLDRYLTAGVPEQVAKLAAVSRHAHLALGMVADAEATGVELMRAAAVQVQLSTRLGLDRLLAGIEALPRKDRWEAQARAALRGDLLSLVSQLTRAALAEAPPDSSSEQVVEAWWERTPHVDERADLLADVLARDPELAPLQVGLRVVRTLLGGRGDDAA